MQQEAFGILFAPQHQHILAVRTAVEAVRLHLVPRRIGIHIIRPRKLAGQGAVSRIIGLGGPGYSLMIPSDQAKMAFKTCLRLVVILEIIPKDLLRKSAA
ncbi:hypothetical protein D3C76_1564520 [compost metagenome]